MFLFMQLGSTYLEVQRKVEESWTTVYTDADWSTKFTWIQLNTSSVRDDINIFTALFDVIAAQTNLRFDIHYAIQRYKNEDWTSDIFSSDLIRLTQKEQKEKQVDLILIINYGIPKT